MNYREKIRKAISCPQFGNINYGEWGALRLDQRKLIKRLLDELDAADECIKCLYLKNEEKLDEPNPDKPVDKETKVVQGHSVVFDTDIEAVIDSNYNIDIVKYYATLMKIEIRETENKILKERLDRALDYNEHLIRDAKYHLNLGHLNRMKKILLGEDKKLRKGCENNE